MFETIFPQLRFAASILFGIPFDGSALERLVDAMLDTRREFGALGSEAGELILGPTVDDETRREVERRRFRTQALRGARETDFYGQLFKRLDVDPARLRHEDIARIPVTPKETVRADPDAFVRRTAQSAFRATTTGTTGWPTSVSFSAAEMQVYIALVSMTLLFQRSVGADDILLSSISSRATLGNFCYGMGCARLGATVVQGGLVEPELTLAMLAEERRLPGKKPRVSLLLTYPSYLGELVECGQRLGYRPSDFGLERINVGGEVVTAGLKARCQALFGPVQFIEGFSMTETWPLGGTVCAEGHLHFEPSHGLVEVLTPEGRAAGPGEVGTLVLTPFPPYRETMVLLRYDTQDAVRRLGGPLTCAQRHLPATTNLLGKMALSVRHDAGWTFPRDILEALEAVEAVPLPARHGFWAVPGGVAVNVVARRNTPAARRQIEASLEARGVPLRQLHLVEARGELRHPFPLRCDLREASFSAPPPRRRAASGAALPFEAPLLVPDAAPASRQPVISSLNGV